MKSRDTSGKNEDMIKSYEIKLVMDTFSQNWGANGPAQSISVSSLESMLVLIFLVHATTNDWNKDLGN